LSASDNFQGLSACVFLRACSLICCCCSVLCYLILYTGCSVFLCPVVITRCIICCVFLISIKLFGRSWFAGVGIRLNRCMISICILVENNTWHWSRAFCRRVRMLDSSVPKFIWTLDQSHSVWLSCYEILFQITDFNAVSTIS
jgi:hypothetical protein